MTLHRTILSLLAFVAAFNGVADCYGRTVLRNIVRVKGHDTNAPHGVGLALGLNGTADAHEPATRRALARAMELMGAPVPEVPLGGRSGLKDLEKVKNVAMVMVNATVPATGARRGDQIDCHVMG